MEQNHQRDKIIRRQLRKQGWQVFVVWECQLKDVDALAERICAFLEDV